MVTVFIVSYHVNGERVFYPESLTAKEAQAMGRSLGLAKMRPSVYKIRLSREQAEKMIDGRLLPTSR